MNARVGLLMSALLAASVTAGCATTTEYIEVRPECEAVPQPVLPAVDAGKLWDAVGDDKYRRLEEREARITTWALRNKAIVEEVCD